MLVIENTVATRHLGSGYLIANWIESIFHGILKYAMGDAFICMMKCDLSEDSYYLLVLAHSVLHIFLYTNSSPIEVKKKIDLIENVLNYCHQIIQSFQIPINRHIWVICLLFTILYFHICRTKSWFSNSNVFFLRESLTYMLLSAHKRYAYQVEDTYKFTHRFRGERKFTTQAH